MYPNLLTLAAAVLVAKATGQQVGTYTTETHPRMTRQRCSSGGSCTTVNGEVVIDSNWRWVHDKNGYTNCYTGNEWNSTICTDNNSCAANCAIDGADYSGTYGVTTSGDALTLKFVTEGSYSESIHGVHTHALFTPAMSFANCATNRHKHRLSSILDVRIRKVSDVHSSWQRVQL